MSSEEIELRLHNLQNCLLYRKSLDLVFFLLEHRILQYTMTLFLHFDIIVQQTSNVGQIILIVIVVVA